MASSLVDMWAGSSGLHCSRRPERLLYKNGFCTTSTFKQLYQEESQEVKDLSNSASKSPFIISSPDFQLAK